jgi:Zn ribbon nucleic-acid-binding protein
MGTVIELGVDMNAEMGTVVEAGSARCPRCMAVADYRFYENATNLRYEVSCVPCGHVHSEVCPSPRAETPAA